MIQERKRHIFRPASIWYNTVCFLLFFSITTSCSAQKNILTRISSAERSDGKGYVIRFHLNSSIDSFNVAQPAPRIVQFGLFGENITTETVNKSVSLTFQQMKIYPLANGVGIILNISGETFYRAEAYPDGASTDILLALTETPQNELIEYTASQSALAWAPIIEPLVGVQPTKALITPYDKLKEKLKFDTVVLDAGHGGQDVGAISYRNNYEKDIVLAITKKVGNYIKKYMPDVNVVYTRDGDYLVGAKNNADISIMESLIERGQIANRNNGDLFVSIHANAAASSQAHGTEVYFLGLERSKSALEVMKRENNVVDLEAGATERIITQQELFVYELANSANIAASQKIAGMISNQFEERAMRRSRGVKQARFVVLYHASMPAVLVETGFVTNPDEGRYLTTEYGQSIIASAIFRAIRDYKEQFEKSQGFTDQE